MCRDDPVWVGMASAQSRAGREMKVLFVMRHSGYVRNFESTLRMLCERGHAVHVAFQTGTHWLLDPGDVTRELGHRYPRFSRGAIPGRDDGWDFVAREVRA